MEPGETLEQAAVREAFEELSYTLQAPRHWLSQPFSYEGRAYRQHIFVERYDGAVLILSEGQAMNWFAPSETAALLMSDHARAAVAALDRRFSLELGLRGRRG